MAHLSHFNQMATLMFNHPVALVRQRNHPKHPMVASTPPRCRREPAQQVDRLLTAQLKALEEIGSA